VECSNRGICDRKTGFCECFDGYDGIACQRHVCPENCNYRYERACLIICQLIIIYNLPWDSMKAVGCICDIAYRGSSCELEECATGPDPIDGFGNESGRDCSGRGICNYNIGICKCFHGYYGSRCERRIDDVSVSSSATI